MNSRQLRRQRHAIRMAKVGLRKFVRSARLPIARFFNNEKFDGGTSSPEPFIYNNCHGIGLREEKSLSWARAQYPDVN